MDNTNGASGIFDIETIDVAGRLLRIGRRSGQKGITPLLLFNGANLELLEPFVAKLDNSIPVIIFDVPGVGGSPNPRLPYRFSGIARLGDQVMLKLGYGGAVDVFGISWGGAAALQFAHDFPTRCRRLVLAATSPGALMVPGKIGAIVNDFLRRVGANLYGGVFRKSPELLSDHVRHIKPPGGIGYAYQVLAGAGWTSLPWRRTSAPPVRGAMH